MAGDRLWNGTWILLHSGLGLPRNAKLARTSRTRVTAIINRNTYDISTDLML
jgi:hypothetical protein